MLTYTRQKKADETGSVERFFRKTAPVSPMAFVVSFGLWALHFAGDVGVAFAAAVTGSVFDFCDAIDFLRADVVILPTFLCNRIEIAPGDTLVTIDAVVENPRIIPLRRLQMPIGDDACNPSRGPRPTDQCSVAAKSPKPGDKGDVPLRPIAFFVDNFKTFVVGRSKRSVLIYFQHFLNHR